MLIDSDALPDKVASLFYRWIDYSTHKSKFVATASDNLHSQFIMTTINLELMNTKFAGGVNIAIKIPKSKYESTVIFYRDVLKLEVEEKPITNPTVSKTHQVKFGPNTVWLDCVDNYTHQEVWLELKTPDVELATKYLASNGISTCDEIEEIPKDMHWIMDPAGTVFILSKD